HRSAHHEAEALARRGLQALQRVPPTAERDQQELSLRLILGVSVMANKGFGAAEVKDVYQRALELCGRQRVSSQAFRVQWLLGLFQYFRAELQSANETADQLLGIANTLDDAEFVLEAHRASGSTLLELGRFNDTLECFRHVSTLYDSN